MAVEGTAAKGRRWSGYKAPGVEVNRQVTVRDENNVSALKVNRRKKGRRIHRRELHIRSYFVRTEEKRRGERGGGRNRQKVGGMVDSATLHSPPKFRVTNVNKTGVRCELKQSFWTQPGAQRMCQTSEEEKIRMFRPGHGIEEEKRRDSPRPDPARVDIVIPPTKHHVQRGISKGEQRWRIEEVE
ncbi:hypothetical protein B0H16DRAFT_1466349 [Mycena metata]|nr:hypothetical protein B0H16DRAFT_1466349 [Mycena metata]